MDYELILNKEDSLKFIKKKKLNHFGEIEIKDHNINKALDFINRFPVKSYFLRELKPSSKNIFYDLNKDEIIKYVRKFEKVGLDVSSLNYYENLILVGEIIIFTNNKVIFSGSTNKKSTHRNYFEPNYFMETDLFDKKFLKIPYINKIIDYVFKNNLFNYIIEFCIFDYKVGVQNEEVVIYEVRNY